MTQVAKLPGTHELAAAVRLLSQATEAVLGIKHAATSVGNAHPDEESVGREPQGRAPTFEDLGRIYSFAIEARASVAELDGYVTALERNLQDLDYARAVRSRGDWRTIAMSLDG